MANKKIVLDKKVAAMAECLTLANVKEVMDKYGFSERSAWYWYRRIIEQLPGLSRNGSPILAERLLASRSAAEAISDHDEEEQNNCRRHGVHPGHARKMVAAS